MKDLEYKASLDFIVKLHTKSTVKHHENVIVAAGLISQSIVTMAKYAYACRELGVPAYPQAAEAYFKTFEILH
jgi:hypothetical protein